MDPSIDEFTAYMQIKAFDVISSGQFRRHLSKSRENGDKWAIQMYNKQNCVQTRLKDITALVGQLDSPSCSGIQKICKDVMSSAQPPIKVCTGMNLCSLTGANAEHCIDLTKVGKASKEVFVHPRFWHFFILLWFCSKLEYVIRACTKQWLDSQKKQEGQNYTDLCELYSEQNAKLIKDLHSLLIKGMGYVSNTLNACKNNDASRPILVPTESFLAC